MPLPRLPTSARTSSPKLQQPSSKLKLALSRFSNEAIAAVFQAQQELQKKEQEALEAKAHAEQVMMQARAQEAISQAQMQTVASQAASAAEAQQAAQSSVREYVLALEQKVKAFEDERARRSRSPASSVTAYAPGGIPFSGPPSRPPTPQRNPTYGPQRSTASTTQDAALNSSPNGDGPSCELCFLPFASSGDQAFCGKCNVCKKSICHSCVGMVGGAELVVCESCSLTICFRKERGPQPAVAMASQPKQPPKVSMPSSPMPTEVPANNVGALAPANNVGGQQPPGGGQQPPDGGGDRQGGPSATRKAPPRARPKAMLLAPPPPPPPPPPDDDDFFDYYEEYAEEEEEEEEEDDEFFDYEDEEQPDGHNDEHYYDTLLEIGNGSSGRNAPTNFWPTPPPRCSACNGFHDLASCPLRNQREQWRGLSHVAGLTSARAAPSEAGTEASISSEAVKSEEEASVRIKDLKDLKLTALPQSASEFRGWKNSNLPSLTSYDVSEDGKLTTWVLQKVAYRGRALESLKKERRFPQFSRRLAATLMQPPTFGIRLSASNFRLTPRWNRPEAHRSAASGC